MRAVSVCSGGGGKDLGFRRAGFRTVALCEVDPWRRRLLARNFPGVPCWPDLTELDPDELPTCDVLIGGTPCQDLSHAGRRAGLDGERSGLFFDYMRIRNALSVPWTVWENVEGALTSNAGLDFACVLGAFVGADVAAPAGGWPGAGVVAGPWGGCVWRVLDAQHFGVPQRRRRVFVVGRLGGPCPPEVLLEPARGVGDLAAGERAWTDFAGPVGGGAHGAGRRTIDDDNYVVGAVTRPDRLDDNAAGGGHIVPALVSRSSRGNPTPLAPGHNTDEHVVTHALTAIGFDASEDGTGRGTPLVPFTVNAAESTARERHAFPTDTARSLDSNGGYAAGQGGTVVGAPVDADGMRAADGLAGRLDGPGVSCIHPDAVGRDGIAKTPSADAEGSVRLRDSGLGVQEDVSYTLGTGAPPAVGGIFPGINGAASAVDPPPDGRRYAACGDGVVAPVAEWIGRRLLSVAEGAKP